MDYVTPVVNGAAQFGVVSADELILTSARKASRCRAVATIFRRSPLVFVMLADSGITRPQDFVGKVIRAPTSTAALHAMTACVAAVPTSIPK